MTRFLRTILAAIGGVALLAASTGGGLAQPAPLDQQLAGSWRLTQDGAKDDGLEANAVGVLIFSSGTFALQIVNADMAPFASSEKRKATPAENQASGKGSLAYFGTYNASDASRALVLHVLHGSFPNMNGTDQKWTVSVTPDKLTLTQGGGVALVWARITHRDSSGRHIIGF
jgi:hypothetical protein